MDQFETKKNSEMQLKTKMQQKLKQKYFKNIQISHKNSAINKLHKPKFQKSKTKSYLLECQKIDCRIRDTPRSSGFTHSSLKRVFVNRIYNVYMRDRDVAGGYKRYMEEEKKKQLYFSVLFCFVI